jgi:cysteine desulfurase / selenocysteine lyase
LRDETGFRFSVSRSGLKDLQIGARNVVIWIPRSAFDSEAETGNWKLTKEVLFMTAAADTNIPFDVQKVRLDFPIFHNSVNGKQLIYLDSAATTQKPQIVLDALTRFYTQECANIHRGVHYLSERATESFETSRAKLRRFINATSLNEIIFVRGSTEAINLVAQTYGRTSVGAGDEVLISAMEHHSNIVPWQILCDEKGARLRIAPINSDGELIFDQYAKLLGPRTRMVAVTGVSNALGTINPLRKIIQLAHAHSIPVLIDGAQMVQHMAVDVQALDCDFFVFSGHKMYGPTGIGVLYGKERMLDALPPYQGGGDMISSVTFEKTTYNKLPYKFEAGTPNVAGGIGLGAAVDYLQSLGLENISAHEQDLLSYCTQRIRAMDEARIIGTAKEKSSVLSFILEGIHPHDIGTILDRDGIAIRTGHHCAQPVMEFYGIPATARASFGVYNTREDIEALLWGLRKVIEVFR